MRYEMMCCPGFDIPSLTGFRLKFVTGDNTFRNLTSPFGHFYLGWTILIRTQESRIKACLEGSKLSCMVDKMGAALNLTFPP